MKSTRWLPATLFGRNVLLIAGLILVAQVGVGLTLLVTVQLPRAASVVRYAVQYTESLRQALEAMNRSQADRYIADLNAAGLTQIVRGNAPADDGLPRELALRSFKRKMEAQLPPGYESRWQQTPERRLWLGTQVHGEMIWFGLATNLLVTDPWIIAVAVLGVAGLFAFGGAYLVQRRINRPLRQLIAATTEMAAGHAPRPLPARGGQEIAVLAQSFNTMVESLAKADRDRALMLAGISHDLRTPLTKLRFALEYVGPHCEPDMRALMERNIEAANRIIDQFIDFARFGGDEPLQTIDLNALATEVAESFGRTNGAIGFELGSIPLLLLRPIAVQRLVLNLLRNALDYAGTGVALRTTSTDDGVTLSVLDRGPGIPALEIQRLKQPFTRLEAARSGPGGSGLGLAIVERVVQLHGGRFELLSREGGGLEARVWLPRTARSP